MTYQISHCRSCEAPIAWAKTVGREGKPPKSIPLDADVNGDVIEFPDGNLIKTGTVDPSGAPFVRYVKAGSGTFRTHFSSCPEAPNWRRK